MCVHGRFCSVVSCLIALCWVCHPGNIRRRTITATRSTMDLFWKHEGRDFIILPVKFAWHGRMFRHISVRQSAYGRLCGLEVFEFDKRATAQLFEFLFWVLDHQISQFRFRQMSGDNLRSMVGLVSSSGTSRIGPPRPRLSSSGEITADGTADEDTGTSFANAVTVEVEDATAVDVEEMPDWLEELTRWNLRYGGSGV